MASPFRTLECVWPWRSIIYLFVLPSKLHTIIEKTLSDRHAARFVWSDFSYSSSFLRPQFVCSGESDVKWWCGHHALLVAGFWLRAKKTLLLGSSVRRATPRAFSVPPAMFYRHSFASRLCSIVELHFRPRYSTPKKSLVRLTHSSSSSTLHSPSFSGSFFFFLLDTRLYTPEKMLYNFILILQIFWRLCILYYSSLNI